MTSALALPPQSVDTSELWTELSITIELLGWASKTRSGGVTTWQIHNPQLLPGLRKAAEVSLASDGVSEPGAVIADMVDGCKGNEFLAYRNLLSESAMVSLAARFQKRFAEGAA